MSLFFDSHPKTLKHLEWQSILDRFAHHCRGDVAKKLALAWQFAENERVLQKRFQRLDEARMLLDERKSPPIGQPEEIVSAVQRASRGSILDAEELIPIALQLEASEKCVKFFSGLSSRYPHLDDLIQGLATLGDLAKEVLNSFDRDGQMLDHASGDLGALRSNVGVLHTQLKNKVHSLLKEEALEDMLQDEYYTIREDRYVLPIKSGHKRHVPGIVHGWSSSGATVFIEPQVVVEANNKLVMAQAEVDKEIRRILTKFSQKVGKFSTQILQTHDALVQLDLIFAAAELSKELKATSPQFTNDNIFHLKHAKHPLLILQNIKVVPNSIHLGDTQPILVVTGPNAGGKTVVMKTVGLCLLMAMAGFHIPADEGSTIPYVPSIFSDMGDEQNLGEGQSTFSGHVVNLRSIFHHLKPNSLILLDELAVGTDPIQGSALAQAVLEYFADQKSLVIVTTHYENLKVLPMQDRRFRNAAVEYDQKEGLPTYQLRYDSPGSSSALSTARRLGLPESLIERAMFLSGNQHRQLEEIIHKMELEVKAAQKAKQDAEIETRKLQQAKAQVERTQEKLNERMRRGLEQERSSALVEIKKLKDYIKATKQKINQNLMSEDELKEIDKTLSNKTDTIHNAVLDSKAELYGPPLDPASIRVGQKVWVITLETVAEVVAAPTDRGKVQVKAGLLSAQVDASSLRAPQQSTQGGQKAKLDTPSAFQAAPATGLAKKKEVSWQNASPQHHGNTADVRGMRGDDAIQEVEKKMEELYAHGENVIFVIHGHGTGILKRYLREWLPNHRYVKGIRPGAPHEGGDGVTAALLG
jgi:DNA mismatch repair protein MutS2